MAKEVLTDATVLYGPYDISGETNQLELGAAVAEVECTNFASGGWREYQVALRDGSLSFEGYTDDAGAEGEMFTGTDELPVTVSKTNPIATADLAWMLETIRTQFSPRYALGELRAFSLSLRGASPIVRGNVLLASTATTTTNGAGLQQGAATAAQRVYAVAHVLTLTGTAPTVDITVESDAGDSWIGAETTRFTFAQVTGAGAPAAESKVINGPVTDTWWRAVLTFGGTVTAAEVVVFIGIQ